MQVTVRGVDAGGELPDCRRDFERFFAFVWSAEWKLRVSDSIRRIAGTGLLAEMNGGIVAMHICH